MDSDDNYLFAKIRTQDYTALISKVSGIWQQVNPGIPFEYSFLDEDFQRTYEQEYRIARIIGVFTILTIGIACLGLFGLAAFADSLVAFCAGRRTGHRDCDADGQFSGDKGGTDVPCKEPAGRIITPPPVQKRP